MNRLTVLLLTAFLLSILLSACATIQIGSSGDKENFLRIGDSTCSKAEAVFLLLEEKAAYEDGKNSEGIWGKTIGSGTIEDYVKEVVKDRLTRYTAAEIMSDELAVYPSEEAKNQAGEDAVAAWTMISGLYNVDEYGITAADVNNLYYKKAVYDAVYDKITSDAVRDITEDSTRVMMADYVVVPHEDGEQPADLILSSIREGVDLSQAAAEMGYPVHTGQKIKRGELNSVVDSIAFALVDGEWSEVIESKDGYYIIHCLDDNLIQESAANYNEILSTTREKAFRDAYYDFSSKSRIWIDERFLDQLDIGSMR